MTSFDEASVLWHDAWLDVPASPRRKTGSDWSKDADVIVIGAGFTGLWTAYHLLVGDPSLRVVVLEAERVGFGASGRNGGWCTPELPLSLDAVDHRHGPGTGAQWRRALVDTVADVQAVCEGEGIDAHWANGGWLQLARNAAQEQRVRDGVDEFRRHGFDDQALRWLEPDEVVTTTRATSVRGASFSSQTTALHPGRLVQGLAAAVERRGGVIVEGARVQHIIPHGVILDGVTAPARWVVRATEAYSVRLARLRRSLIPVYSMMIATAPLSPDQWDEIGLAQRAVFNDARRGVIYGQRTADGRLAFGGRGAPYHLGSGIEARFDAHRGVRAQLAATLAELFPAVAATEVTHHWGGPLGIARDWHPSVGMDMEHGWAWAGGYVGEGVAAAALAGRTLAELITNRTSVRTELAWVHHRSRRWEPEPLRWLGINAMVRLARYADRREAAGRRTSHVVDTTFARLVGH
jgi:glycine/D-amino acid oxidase-like deaminating enzyme